MGVRNGVWPPMNSKSMGFLGTAACTSLVFTQLWNTVFPSEHLKVTCYVTDALKRDADGYIKCSKCSSGYHNANTLNKQAGENRTWYALLATDNEGEVHVVVLTGPKANTALDMVLWYAHCRKSATEMPSPIIAVVDWRAIKLNQPGHAGLEELPLVTDQNEEQLVQVLKYLQLSGLEIGILREASLARVYYVKRGLLEYHVLGFLIFVAEELLNGNNGKKPLLKCIALACSKHKDHNIDAYTILKAQGDNKGDKSKGEIEAVTEAFKTMLRVEELSYKTQELCTKLCREIVKMSHNKCHPQNEKLLHLFGEVHDVKILQGTGGVKEQLVNLIDGDIKCYPAGQDPDACAGQVECWCEECGGKGREVVFCDSSDGREEDYYTDASQGTDVPDSPAVDSEEESDEYQESEDSNEEAMEDSESD